MGRFNFRKKSIWLEDMIDVRLARTGERDRLFS